MLIFGSLVAEGYAQLAAHPMMSAAVGAATAFLASWLMTRPRSRV